MDIETLSCDVYFNKNQCIGTEFVRTSKIALKFSFKKKQHSQKLTTKYM